MQYRTALDQERFLEEEVQSLNSDAQRMTTRLTGMPGTGPNPDRLSRAVERLDAARAQLDSQIEACMGIRCKVARAISAVPNLTAREVLRRRYVDGQSYAEIADEMGLVERRVYQLHRMGLQKLEPEKQAGFQ